MVKLALYVRLEAKPGKEKDVENFLLAACRSSTRSPERSHGSLCDSARPPLRFSTRSTMKLAATRICPAR